MKRTTGVIGVLLAMSLALTGCASGSGGEKSSAAEKAPIKVGAILSLTGTYAGLGQPEEKALKLQVKLINEAGGINGRKIDLLIEDDATDDAKANAAASKLIEQDGVVAILGATGTGGTMAARQVIDRAGVPQISMAGGTVITDKFDKLVFQTPWSNRIVVPFVLDTMKKAGITKVAVLSDTGGYGKDGRAVIQQAAASAGVTLVTDETFNPGDTDFTAQLTKVKNSDAQGFLLWTAGKEGAPIVKAARQLGVTLPMYGGSGQARTEFITGAGADAEGFTIGTGRNFVRDAASEGALGEFTANYKTANGEAPDIFAGHAFDAISILADALERAKSDDPAAVRDAIEATKDLKGYAGSFTFSATDHNGLTTDDLGLFVVKGGAWTVAK